MSLTLLRVLTLLIGLTLLNLVSLTLGLCPPRFLGLTLILNRLHFWLFLSLGLNLRDHRFLHHHHRALGLHLAPNRFHLLLPLLTLRNLRLVLPNLPLTLNLNRNDRNLLYHLMTLMNNTINDARNGHHLELLGALLRPVRLLPLNLLAVSRPLPLDRRTLSLLGLDLNLVPLNLRNYRLLLRNLGPLLLNHGLLKRDLLSLLRFLPPHRHILVLLGFLLNNHRLVINVTTRNIRLLGDRLVIFSLRSNVRRHLTLLNELRGVNNGNTLKRPRNTQGRLNRVNNKTGPRVLPRPKRRLVLRTAMKRPLVRLKIRRGVTPLNTTLRFMNTTIMIENRNCHRLNTTTTITSRIFLNMITLMIRRRPNSHLRGANFANSVFSTSNVYAKLGLRMTVTVNFGILGHGKRGLRNGPCISDRTP